MGRLGWWGRNERRVNHRLPSAIRKQVSSTGLDRLAASDDVEIKIVVSRIQGRNLWLRDAVVDLICAVSLLLHEVDGGGLTFGIVSSIETCHIIKSARSWPPLVLPPRHPVRMAL